MLILFLFYDIMYPAINSELLNDSKINRKRKCPGSKLLLYFEICELRMLSKVRNLQRNIRYIHLINYEYYFDLRKLEKKP